MNKRPLLTLLVPALLLQAISLQGKELFVYLLNVTAQKELTRSIFDKQTLDISNAPFAGNSLSSALAHVGGLDLRGYGVPGSLSTVAIRGGSASQTLLAVEDVPFNSTQNGLMDLSLFPSSAFSRVDIIKGGGSSIYGANASSGYVNFYSARPTSTYASVSSYYGSFGHLRNSVEAEAEFKNRIFLRGLAQFETCRNDFAYTNSGLSLQRTNAGFTNLHFFGSAEFKNARLSSRLTVFYNDKKVGIPGMPVIQNPKAFQKDTTLFTSWKSIFFSPLYTEILVSWMRAVNRYADPFMPGGAVDDTHRTSQLYAAFSQEWERGIFSLRYGVEDRFNGINSTSVGLRDRNLFSHFASGQASLLHDKIKLSARYRYEISTVYTSIINYNFGVNAEIGFKTVVRANYGTSFREPTFNDLYWPADAYSQGNPGLRPELSKNFDAGIENRILRLLAVKFSFFQNDYTDLIIWTPGTGGKWSPENISAARYRGAEAGAELALDGFFTAEFNYMKLYAVNGEPGPYAGKYMPNMPFDRINAAVGGRFGRFKAQVAYHYTGFSFITKANTAAEALLTPVSHKLGASLMCELFKGLSANLTAENLLDDRAPGLNNQPVPGRTFGIEMKYAYQFKQKNI